MGVNGLWTVIQPCARPTNLATLNRKRLAVDASIWIYQFLKAVRDKEGNALRNSHIVGFFRRICKLLWFGILPVFVFDGGAPALKRATIQKRKQRREGRREDAIRTAGKLLAIQMQRLAEEEEEKRRKESERPRASRAVEEEEEVIPDASKLVYVDEIGMSQQERMRNRKFYKQDAYHLPELENGIASMGKPDDPRIMSVEELEEYARQFNNGEDINLYDFSKIDFDGDFFKSLPPPDRYNILNAARLRSRLRMGLSKEQLDDMFPDRMAFSRFQIERVKERNHLTQRLMYEVGMLGTDLTLNFNARIAGEKDREYILVKNEGVEGGWALGVVSKEKDVGEAHKPIDVDAIQFQYQTKEEESEEEDDFEDVPIVGINRLPKISQSAAAGLEAAQDINTAGEGSLFVDGQVEPTVNLLDEQPTEPMHPEEEHDLNLAIALSLQNQHGIGQETDEGSDVEDESREKPEWTQVAVEAPKPIIGRGGGSMIAHIVNNRANAAVPKRQETPITMEREKDSDSEDDMQAVLAKSRKMKKAQPKPVFENKKNPFDGPLPFPKLDWGSSLFAKKKVPEEKPIVVTAGGDAGPEEEEKEDETGGGFETKAQKEDGPKPLPPWLVDNDTDIREAIQQQKDVEREINAQDRAEMEEEERLRKRELRDQLIEIESSDEEDGSDDVTIVEIPPSPEPVPILSPAKIGESKEEDASMEEFAAESTAPENKEEDGDESPEPEFEDLPIIEAPSAPVVPIMEKETQNGHESPEPEFEDVEPSERTLIQEHLPDESVLFEDISPDQPPVEAFPANTTITDEELFGGEEYDEFSDPEDEELLAQMAGEAEEHARFASELNNKSTEQNREDYERELRALRSQQKKDRRDADEVTQTMITECQALLRLFGIPYITAPMEAEAQCAELVRLNMVDGIVTDDSDTFLFGGTRVYKNMFNSNKFVECYVGADLDKELSLSREQLISLAQLLGSDYTEGLPGVGPVTAVEILSEFPGKDGLDQFREWWRDVQSSVRSKEADASSSFRRKFRKSQATKLFLPVAFPSPAVYEAYLHPVVDSSTEPFQWGVPDVAGLREYLMATIGWSKERTDEVLVPVIRDMNKREIEGTQSNITRFFGGSVGAGARETFAPRQRVQGSKRMAAAVDRLRANIAGEGAAPEVDESSGANKRRKTTRRK
ncbi:hypothetical protein TRIATDRAFT_41742 [Trichoderma atroviride IMI 206040]|uniref:Uncharacterized protein n=1 Tax=Hypocrea atroviridis (strain ATCC 20476 / IMI 206040) TaxID=452589 RepID=G9P9R6_HYPAI|nr:uncharacterized protein TRIATDRAFT_41742 [Trichoderma atroviride IMI 206040]EHK40388.1 hypothetical protein TRIATDRAFT_41742 [Trichoderma atroviride IMI 206040]